MLLVGINLPTGRHRKQRFALAARQALQQREVFLALQQLVVQPQDILCHPRDGRLRDDHLRLVGVVHFGKRHPGGFPEEGFACLPVFLFGSHIGLERTQQAVHLVEGSKGTVVLGIGRKELADEHRHTVHRVFGQLQGTVGS